ncbi:hypothetical protein LINPERPRIM_LOCUS20654, partial [Linum perenne]
DLTPCLPVLLPHLPLRLLPPLHCRHLHLRLALHIQAGLLLHRLHNPQGPPLRLHHLHLHRFPHARLQNDIPYLHSHLHPRDRHSEPSPCSRLAYHDLRSLPRRPRLHHRPLVFGAVVVHDGVNHEVFTRIVVGGFLVGVLVIMNLVVGSERVLLCLQE